MRNERVEAFESTLLEILKTIDHQLECDYGASLQRHPARPANGATANPQYDGLFSVVANFTAGIGSKYGAGYTLDLRISTLNSVENSFREKCERQMVETLRAKLPSVFPHRQLRVERDLHGWKLFGDLSLD